MSFFRPIFFCVVAVSFSLSANARILSLGKENFGSYLNFSYGTKTLIADSTIVSESSAATFSEEFKTIQGGEFGFVYVAGSVSLRFGFEIIKPLPIEAAAKSGSGTTVYRVKSDVLGYMPKIGLDLNIVRRPSYRLFLNGYIGQASVTVNNAYSDLTIAPSAAFGSKYKGSCSAYGGGLGFEMAAFDNTSLVIEGSHRTCVVRGLLYAEAVTDFIGAHAVGDDVLLTDGTNRSLSLNGMTATIGMRWWIQ